MRNQNRMKSDLNTYAARLREWISHGATVAPAGVAGRFSELALELFALQFDHNPPYRRFCEARGASPQNIKDWADIPAVPTTGFKELELTCLAEQQRVAVFHSSGTTGQQPSRHFHSVESLVVYEASLWSWFREKVLGDLRFTIYDLRLICLTPPPGESPHSSLVHMFDTVRRKLGAPETVFVGRAGRDGAWVVEIEAALAQLQRACEGIAPLVLLGTAFSFVHLLDALTREGARLELPPGSRVMETGGYKGRSRSLAKPKLHSLITEWLGILPARIVCEYGMSELSSQAYSGPTVQGRGSSEEDVLSRAQASPGAFRFPPWARVQVVSPEDGREVHEGETGLIRVFDLANVFSVLALQTEDLGIRREAGFELLGRAALAEPRGCSLMSLAPLGH